MKKHLALLLALCLLAALLAGCASPADTPDDSQPSDTTDPASGSTAKDSLVIAAGADIYSMDPQLKKDTPSARIKALVFETLVNVTADNEVVPGLAESWEFIDDTTIHFTIREGVTFHNGEALTMDDILYSFQRGENAPQTSITMDPIDVANCKAVDDRTFEMKLKYPYGAILLNLTDTCCDIVDKSYIEEVGDDEFALKPVGTGPYIFTNWVSGDRAELTRYDGYWGEKPAIKDITFRVVTEAAQRAIELETGGVDVALDILPADISRIEENPDLTLERGPNYSVTYMAMNMNKEPFNIKEVRQAITLALDLPSIVDAVYEGTGAVGQGPLTASVYAFNDAIEPAQQDVERAKQLLAEAGYPDGFSTAILTSDHQQRVDFSEIAQNQLAAIGIECQVDIMEWGAYLDAVFAGEHEMTVLGYSYGLDPGTGLYSLFHSDSFGPDGNIAWYQNDEVDRLLTEAQTEMDEQTRIQMFKDVQTIVTDEAPWVFIWQGENINGTAANLRGWENRGDGQYRFMDMYFE